MSNTRKLRVFLCYARRDRGVVKGLYDRLIEESWVSPWMDLRLIAGQYWDIEINNALSKADVVLVCLSNISVNKEGYIQKELRMVLERANLQPPGSIFIVPVYLEKCKPRFDDLSQFQAINYFPKRLRKERYESLRRGLIRRAQELRIPVNGPRLLGKSGEYIGKTINVGQTISLGRGEPNTVKFKDLTISRKHAQIIHYHKKYYLIDLKSNTGTFLNGKRILPSKGYSIMGGDKIAMGNLELFEFSEK